VPGGYADLVPARAIGHMDRSIADDDTGHAQRPGSIYNAVLAKRIEVPSKIGLDGDLVGLALPAIGVD
jgi:hypothetical protein